MTDLFTRRRDIASCHAPNRAIWENVAMGNCVLQLWLMTEPSEVQPISHQHSAILNVKISDLLEFLVMLLFSFLCSHPKRIYRKLQDFENSHGEMFF